MKTSQYSSIKQSTRILAPTTPYANATFREESHFPPSLHKQVDHARLLLGTDDSDQPVQLFAHLSLLKISRSQEAENLLSSPIQCLGLVSNTLTQSPISIWSLSSARTLTSPFEHLEIIGSKKFTMRLI